MAHLVKSVHSDNDGKSTRFNNVMSGTELLNTPIVHGTDGPNAPTTYSVQDLRLHLALGFRL